MSCAEQRCSKSLDISALEWTACSDAANTSQSDKSDTLTLTATGTGDLSDLTSHLQPQRASFAYAKVKYNNDEHSFREKFILVIWIGEEVKVMRRAKVGVRSTAWLGRIAVALALSR